MKVHRLACVLAAAGLLFVSDASVGALQLKPPYQYTIGARDVPTAGVPGQNLTVSIKGEVVKPGEYRLTDAMNVLQLIALAGGFTAAATKESIVIIRKTPLPGGRANRIFFNYKKVLGGLPASVVPQLQPGDHVLIR